MPDYLPETSEAFERRVVVAAFDSVWEAELALARLTSEGFRAVLADANLVRLDWFLVRAVGGIKVLVPVSEAAAAQSILESVLTDGGAELPAIGLATAADRAAEPRCPRCRSDAMTAERWSRGGFVGSLLLLGFPVPIPSKRWRCGGCRKVWRPEELD